MTRLNLGPGDVVADRYEIVGLLGSGGFAQVFRAVQRDLEREIALKVMLPDTIAGAGPSGLSDSKMDAIVVRFSREAKTVSKFKSPHTVAVHDFGKTSEGYLFMALELVEGVDLKTVLKQEGPLPEHRVRKIISQILASLHEAHSFGVLHRDIKPANIMLYEHLGERDLVKVLDFGVAKLFNRESDGLASVTQPDRIVGTPRYMAPEYVRSSELSPASDLYGVGLIAFELLTGTHPINTDDTMQAWGMLLSPDPFELPDPDAVSPEFRAIVNQMITKDPMARYQSAREVLRDLAAVDQGTVEIARPVLEDVTSERGRSGTVERLRDESGISDEITASGDVPEQGERMRWWLPVLVAAPALLILAVAGMLFLNREQQDDGPQVAAEPTVPAPPLPTAAENTSAAVATDSSGGYRVESAISRGSSKVTIGVMSGKMAARRESAKLAEAEPPKKPSAAPRPEPSRPSKPDPRPEPETPPEDGEEGGGYFMIE